MIGPEIVNMQYLETIDPIWFKFTAYVTYT